MIYASRNDFDTSTAAGSASGNRDLLQALTGCDGKSEVAVSRTRRIVQSTVINMEEQRQRSRRQTGFAMLFSLLFLTLLAPALWSSVDSFAAGSHFGDLPTQSYLLGVMLFPGILAAAIAVFTRQRNQRRRQWQ